MLQGIAILLLLCLAIVGRQTYRFESVTKQEAAFFFDAGEIVFLGDHTTFTVRDDQPPNNPFC